MASGSGFSAAPLKKSAAKKNAYVCFIYERKKQEEAKGNQQPSSLKDLIPVFAEEWAQMDEAARAPYKLKAGKSTNTGSVCLHPEGEDSLVPPRKVITAQQVLADRNAQKQFRFDLQINIANLLDMSQSDPTQHVFVLANFNVYAITDEGVHIPAEVALTAFSIQRGVFDNYSTLIDPGKLPLCTGVASKESREKCDLPEPPFHHGCTNYEEILKTIDKFLGRYPILEKPKAILFCLERDIPKVTGCLKWLCYYAGVPYDYTVYPYSLLLQKLTNQGRRLYMEGQSKLLAEGETLELEDPTGIAENRRFLCRRIPHTTAHEMAHMKINKPDPSDYSSYVPLFKPRPRRIFNICHPPAKPKEKKPEKKPYTDPDVFMFERMADEFLRSQDMRDYEELCCPHHMVNFNKTEMCALNITNRHAYVSLDILVGYYGVPPVEGVHYPLESSSREMEKRRGMLAMWGIHGYTGLEGFLDSIDFNFEEDTSSSGSVSSDTEGEYSGSSAQGRRGIPNKGSSGSLDNISDLEFDDDDGTWEAKRIVLPMGSTTSTTRGEVIHVSRATDVESDSEKIWTVQVMGGEKFPRVIFDHSDSIRNSAADCQPSTSTSRLATFSPPVFWYESEGEFSKTSGIGNSNSAQLTTTGESSSSVPIPASTGIDYPHYFNTLFWSFERGVRTELPHEEPIEMYKRQKRLQDWMQKRRTVYQY